MRPSPTTDVPLRVVVVVALAMALGLAVYRYSVVWTPLQREYLATYVWSALLWGDGEVGLLHVVDATGSRLALDEELVSVTSATGERTFGLSEIATRVGAQRLEQRRQRYAYTELYRILQASIFRGQTLIHLAAPPVWTALVLLLGGVIGIQTHQIVTARQVRERSSAGADAEPWLASPSATASRPWPQEFFE